MTLLSEFSLLTSPLIAQSTCQVFVVSLLNRLSQLGTLKYLRKSLKMKNETSKQAKDAYLKQSYAR